MNFKQYLENYQGSHKPPTNGAPLYDLTKVYPEDVYSHIEYYVVGEFEKECGLLALKYKNRPDKFINIYRAVPKGVTIINPNDWVTISKKYAIQHSKHSNDPDQDYDVIKSTVRADNLVTDGNSLAEWGYVGSMPLQAVSIK